MVLLKPLVTSPLIEVGEYSSYGDPNDLTAFETRNVLYHYGPEKLVIGKFCAFAEGVRFVMNGANHRMDGPSTFPFPIMGGAWAEHFDLLTGLPGRGDTVIGHDVWRGYRSTVMPGVRAGNGAIVAAGSVVTSDIARLLAVAWWDWPAGYLTRHLRTVMSGTVADLEAAAPPRP